MRNKEPVDKGLLQVDTFIELNLRSPWTRLMIQMTELFFSLVISLIDVVEWSKEVPKVAEQFLR